MFLLHQVPSLCTMALVLSPDGPWFPRRGFSSLDCCYLLVFLRPLALLPYASLGLHRYMLHSMLPPPPCAKPSTGSHSENFLIRGRSRRFPAISLCGGFAWTLTLALLPFGFPVAGDSYTQGSRLTWDPPSSDDPVCTTKPYHAGDACFFGAKLVCSILAMVAR